MRSHRALKVIHAATTRILTPPKLTFFIVEVDEDDDEDDLQEIELDNIVAGGRRTRGKAIDFAKANEDMDDEDDEEEDDDFIDPDEDDEMKD